MYLVHSFINMRRRASILLVFKKSIDNRIEKLCKTTYNFASEKTNEGKKMCNMIALFKAAIFSVFGTDSIVFHASFFGMWDENSLPLISTRFKFLVVLSNGQWPKCNASASVHT